MVNAPAFSRSGFNAYRDSSSGEIEALPFEELKAVIAYQIATFIPPTVTRLFDRAD